MSAITITPRYSARVAALIMLIALGTSVVAQTAGPNNPGTTGNNASIGTNAWLTTGGSSGSDNTYASEVTRGISQFLTGTNFGFSIPTTSGILGIQLDVEHSTSGSQDVALLDGWSTGLAKAIGAGTNRCLLVAYAQENGTDSRDITAMTYGGRAMTQVAQQASGTTGGFVARAELWILLEADIALAGSTTIVPTYGSYSAFEYCEAFSSATFKNVDQVVAVSASQISGTVNAANPHQLSAAIATIAGSMAVNVVTNGTNTAPASVDGATNTYTINSGYTEGTDLYFANTAVAPTSGACLQTAHKLIATNGTEQPACTFAGSINRWAMIGITLQRAREMDYRVQLIKGGVIGGTDMASGLAWPIADAYTSYGGPSNLWGLSWTVANINATNFGAAMATRVQNGTARVDNMRITVTYYSTLPIELLYFRATPDGHEVRLDWATASEQDNDRFIVQRSSDAVTFEDVTQITGAGNSQVMLVYGTMDEHPLPGTSYYRLEQVDTDGTKNLSTVVAVTRELEPFSIYPNPTSDGSLTIFDAAARTLAVGVYDNTMHLVRQAAMQPGDPMALLGDLPEGTYTLLVRSGDEVHASRVVKTSRSR